jgi:condensation enzyme
VDQSKIHEESPNRYPLTSRQKDPGGTERSAKHVLPLALRIKGELHIDALKGALDDVVERHESLRTRINYSETDGNIGFQEVLPPLPVPFTVHDIPTIPGRSRDEMAVDLFLRLNEELLPFSVTPSLRASLHRFDDRDAVLTFLTHHLYGDNWSAGILRREFAACYRARVSGVPHALPTPVQYREYASWEQEFLQSEKAASARRFWLDKLAGIKMYTMPADRPHGPDAWTSRSAIKGFSIDSGDFAKVVASAIQNRCTVWHLFLTAIMVLADKVCGLSDITLLTVDNGRTSKNFHNTIGFFANLVPLRLEFGNCESFLDLMLLARKASMDAHQNQISFGTILELVPDLMEAFDDARALPVGFNYLRSTVSLADLQFADSVEPVFLPEDVPSMYHRGACMWSFILLPSGAFRCVIEYEPDMVDADTIDHWGSDFISLMLAITDRPDQAWKNR